MNKNIIVIGGVGLLVLVIVLLNINKTEEKAVSVENKIEEKTKVEPVAKIDYHLDDAEIKVSNNSLSANLNSIGLMPLNGESGALWVTVSLQTREQTRLLFLQLTEVCLIVKNKKMHRMQFGTIMW